MTTFSAVVTTGIYCRPGCGAKPLAENVRTFELAASAEAAGFRACLCCRPYRVFSPIGCHAPELVCRAVQLIIDGVLDNGTEEALGARLAISARHLRRMFNEHLGVTPDQLARSRRAHFARRLLDDSDLTIAEVAFASGFGSIRQFNRDMREVFRASPSELRSRRRRTDRLAADGGLMVRLPLQQPFDWGSVAAFLAERAVPGVESVEDGVYRRTISLDGAAGVLEVCPGGVDHLLLCAHLPYWEGLIHVAERAGRMVGIDGDIGPAVVHLANDPTIGALVTAQPGMRVPSAWGAFEVAVHSVVAQHCSLARARTRMGTLVRCFGLPVPGLTHRLTHLFPSADVLADGDLAATGFPQMTTAAIRGLATSVASGDVMLDSGAGLADLVASLTAIPGIGPAAAYQIALRLGHRDAFPESDPCIRRALRDLGALGSTQEIASRWRPWRAIAAMYLITHAASVRHTPYASAAAGNANPDPVLRKPQSAPVPGS
jgi:AraC family transcriptional regulator, regulatory protein of adaptative response / DNA-3-methyladenine glycosylase II